MVKLISVFIIGALTLQMTAILLRTGPYAYPFVNYPMYAAAHYEGERILVEHTIYARFTDGTERLSLGRTWAVTTGSTRTGQSGWLNFQETLTR